MYTLFGMTQGKVITATLSLALAIDRTISFAPDFILEQDVREVYRLDLSEIEKQIQMGLTVDPSRRQCPGQHPVTAQRIQHYRQISPHPNRHPKSIPLTRLTVVYRKRLSNPFGGGRQVKDQHWWPPLSALLRPISILPTDIAIKYPQRSGTAGAAEGLDAPAVAGNIS